MRQPCRAQKHRHKTEELLLQVLSTALGEQPPAVHEGQSPWLSMRRLLSCLFKHNLLIVSSRPPAALGCTEADKA
jgi:hypothetical protein